MFEWIGDIPSPLRHHGAIKCKHKWTFDHIQEHASDIEIDCLDLFVASYQSLLINLPTTDILISAIDTPPIESSKNAALFSLIRKVPILLGGVGYGEITAGPLLTTEAAKERYLARLSGITTTPDTAIRGSLPSTNSLLSAILTNEIINFFYSINTNECINIELVIDAFSLERKREIYYENSQRASRNTWIRPSTY